VELAARVVVAVYYRRFGGDGGFGGGWVVAVVVVVTVIVVVIAWGDDGVADGAAVEVEFVDEFFADVDLNACGWIVGDGRVVAGEDLGVVGGGGAVGFVPVEEEFEGGGVVGGGVLGDGEVDVAGGVVAGGECSSEVGVQRSRVSWRFGGGGFFSRFLGGRFGRGNVVGGVLI